MSGLPTLMEREQALNELQDIRNRIVENHLDRETLLAIQAALRDFGKRYLNVYYPAEQ